MVHPESLKTELFDDARDLIQAETTMQFVAELFIWWHKQTMGVRWLTFTSGHCVGADEFGNKYYRHRKNDRRWVIYKGAAEPTSIPPGWHGWMHHRTDVLPNDANYTPHAWQQPHQPNHTGTSAAYRPDGSLLNKGQRPEVTGDYEAWSPDN